MGIKRKGSDLTAVDIINGFCNRTLLQRSSNKVYPNFYLGPWECDILEITKSGYTYEYEVKISRHDFNIDGLKHRRGSRKYDVLKAGKRVNYFSYVVPEGLISPEDVPPFAGLVYARGYEQRIRISDDEEYVRPGVMFSTVKEPQRLKDDKISPEEIDEVNKKIYFRYHKLRLKEYGQKLVTPFGIS
jgi:hypothetical protein